MKIIQNIYQENEYEYAKEYKTLAEAQKDIDEYTQEDREQGKWHSYTLVDEQGEDIAEKARAEFEEQAKDALISLGLEEDEAERAIEDYQFNY